MSDVSAFVLPKHVRRRRPSFVLTSLIDVIFLLVIFFMVSSQITPFSLIALGPVTSKVEATTPADPGAAPPAIAIRILSGRVSIGGNSVSSADVGAALTGLKDNGVASVVLIPGGGSTVQDLVSVLEACKEAAFASVTIVNRQAAKP